MTGTQKTVNIKIAPTDLTFLKDNKYKLCFAKKVNDTYDVVWQSYDEYLATNSFMWTPVFQLFGTNEFVGNVTVKASTTPVNIELGQQSTMNKDGILSPASTGGPSTAITLVNDYGPIHPGVNQMSTGITGKQLTTPIYVAQDQIALGSDVLTPVEEVQVWFEQNIVTSTMFSDARSNAVTIDVTETNTQTRQYSGGRWNTPSSSDLALAVIPILQIIVYVTGALIAHDLASKIASKLTGVYKDITVDVTSGENNKFTVIYKERNSITAPEQSFLATLMASPLTNDRLMEFTVDSLAQSGVGYYNIEATT